MNFREYLQEDKYGNTGSYGYTSIITKLIGLIDNDKEFDGRANQVAHILNLAIKNSQFKNEKDKFANKVNEIIKKSK